MHSHAEQLRDAETRLTLAEQSGDVAAIRLARLELTELLVQDPRPPHGGDADLMLDG